MGSFPERYNDPFFGSGFVNFSFCMYLYKLLKNGTLVVSTE